MRLHITRRRVFLASVIVTAASAIFVATCGENVSFDSYVHKKTSSVAANGDWSPRPIQVPDEGCPALDPDAESPGPGATDAPSRSTTRFAAIGDYGYAGPNEQAVADLVKAWRPEFIVTLGDNNYPLGAADTIDLNI